MANECSGGIEVRRRAPTRRPSRGLRWASRVEAWPARCWLGVQFAATLPVGFVLQDRLDGPAAALPAIVTWGLLLVATCFGGRRPDWPARPRWLLAAAAATVLATIACFAPGPGPAASTAAVAALLALAGAGCARAAFGIGNAGRAAVHGRRPQRHAVQAALKRLQFGAACKCAYCATLIACGIAAAGSI